MAYFTTSLLSALLVFAESISNSFASSLWSLEGLVLSLDFAVFFCNLLLIGAAIAFHITELPCFMDLILAGLVSPELLFTSLKSTFSGRKRALPRGHRLPASVVSRGVSMASTSAPSGSSPTSPSMRSLSSSSSSSRPGCATMSARNALPPRHQEVALQHKEARKQGAVNVTIYSVRIYFVKLNNINTTLTTQKMQTKNY
ncbi:hypothetical protein L596_022251 [Steinernema carpocapsae]|uniref:Uncharacterized protein n=1 Tax=Steinernema carpocapsae TaxID=34508 RepID=A0A4U5ML49_STECR|nr:hypothetical protein L596_022251 [Steinernema carpocapsae]